MILEHKGIPVFFSDYGHGNAVVLLHGFLENSSMWNPFIGLLSQKNRIICIDLLGHGKTGCLGYIHSMELMAETVEAILNHLNIKKYTFIGHSMGGYVALAFAERNPNTINGLCLMNSTADEDTLEKRYNRNRAILAVKQNHKLFIRMAVANLFSPKNRTLFSEQITGIIENAQKTSLQGVIAALEGMKIRKKRRLFFENAPFKKLFILGKKDPVLNYKLLVSQAEKSDIKIIKFSGGHMSHIENKDKFLQCILHFI